MSERIPFAGLRPDDRRVRGVGELESFDLLGAVELGRRIVQWRGAPLSRSEAARLLGDAIHALDQHGRPAFMRVCVHAARLGERSSIEPLAAVGSGAASEAEGARPGAGDEPAARAVLAKMRIGDVSCPGASVAVIREPDLRSLGLDPKPPLPSAAPSLLGLGAVCWPEEAFVITAWTAVPSLEPAVLRALRTFATYGKLLWIRTTEAEAALGRVGQLEWHGRALEEIVAAHENNQREVALELRRAVEAARAETASTAAIAKEKLEAEKTTLRRTQNAMLNVIEDLGAARKNLQATVEEQTRTLAETNRALEARNRELEEFVYIASHDLQEPLRTVAGYLQMIQRRYGKQLGVEADEFIQFAIEGSQWMQKLIESLLVYSRTATRERTLEVLSLDEPLDTALHNLKSAIEDSRAVVERGPLPRIRADRVEMVQLFQNLISNAVRFAGEAPPHVTIDATVASEVCAIAVRDRGIGFNPKFADRIFKVFRRLQRDKPGTGIGLSVCKKIAERHGGRIEAHAEPGRGATFVVHLPIGISPGEEQ